MAEIFDTHCHLFMEPLSIEPEAVAARAAGAGVTRILVPAVSRESWDQCGALRGIHGVSIALGVHPWWAGEGIDPALLRESILTLGACAIGEAGLDWKCDTPVERQLSVLESQLILAGEMDIPVILHCRGAFQELLEMLSLHPVRGTIHAWSRHPSLMERFLALGLHISFGGAVTRGNAQNARASAAAVPSNRFLLETDSPSIGLEGVPAGGSEPAHTAAVLSEMSSIRKEPPETTAELALENSLMLFGESNG